ncbi:hypothetical protein Egran_02828 [Elaphomyces granulatus]|uniref:Uncharacterized protein n=1 Tax=Elaphomyces granulatus TaxID=519963 RepID=A0A232LZ19_9EURO|nr:hypothetical protein Egran_02828 [Elaphomyces granulatus]
MVRIFFIFDHHSIDFLSITDNTIRCGFSAVVLLVSSTSYDGTDANRGEAAVDRVRGVDGNLMNICLGKLFGVRTWTCGQASRYEQNLTLHVSCLVPVPATLQGPPWSTVPDLKIISDIPLEIQFYNEAGEELTNGSVAICFGMISFQDRSPGLPRLSVKASRVNPCPGDPLLETYIDALPPMMNAFLDFVGVVNQRGRSIDMSRSACVVSFFRETGGT